MEQQYFLKPYQLNSENIEITYFVETYKRYREVIKTIIDLVGCYSEDYFKWGYNYNKYKVENVFEFIEKTKHFILEYDEKKYNNGYINIKKEKFVQFVNDQDKYKSLLGSYTGDITDYGYRIVHIDDDIVCQKFLDFYELVGNTIQIYPEYGKEPFWMEYLPYPEHGGDEEGVYFKFLFDDDYDNFFWKYTIQSDDRMKCYSIALVLKNECIFYIDIARTCH